MNLELTPEKTLEALTELEASLGWQIIQSHLQNEIVETAFRLSAPGPMTPQNIDFERGCMWAGRQLIASVPKLRQQADNAVLLITAKAKAATAAETHPR